MNHQTKNLLEGHDASAYTLPPEMLAARKAVDVLDGTWPERPADPADVRHDLATQTVAAARQGQPLPTPDDYLAAVARHEKWVALTETLAAAREQANLDLSGLLTSSADAIIAEHLAPAMAELQAQLAEIAKVLPADVTDRQMASPVTNAKARTAWRDLDALAVRYGLIRQAQNLCYRAGGGDPQDEGIFATVADLLAVWPRWRQRTAGIGAHSAPWPEDPRNFLLWIQHHGATFVVLTRAEREQRWQGTYGEETEQRRQTKLRARSLGGLIA